MAFVYLVCTIVAYVDRFVISMSICSFLAYLGAHVINWGVYYGAESAVLGFINEIYHISHSFWKEQNMF
jgi:hypothetical protein